MNGLLLIGNIYNQTNKLGRPILSYPRGWSLFQHPKRKLRAQLRSIHEVTGSIRLETGSAQIHCFGRSSCNQPAKLTNEMCVRSFEKH